MGNQPRGGRSTNKSGNRAKGGNNGKGGKGRSRRPRDIDDGTRAEELEIRRPLRNAFEVSTSHVGNETDDAKFLQGGTEHVSRDATSQAIGPHILDGQHNRLGSCLNKIQEIM